MAQHVRGDRHVELAADPPRPLVAREIDLAAHHHGEELVGGREMLRLHPVRVFRIAAILAVTLEIAQHGAAAGLGERRNGGIGVLGRVVDLRDVEHRRDAGVELAQRAE
jgi:hypothetical protein